jgi:hypothetical protein
LTLSLLGCGTTKGSLLILIGLYKAWQISTFPWQNTSFHSLSPLSEMVVRWVCGIISMVCLVNLWEQRGKKKPDKSKKITTMSYPKK